MDIDKLDVVVVENVLVLSFWGLIELESSSGFYSTLALVCCQIILQATSSTLG